MPFRFFSLGASIFPLVAAWVMSLFGGKRKFASSRYEAPIVSSDPLSIPDHPGCVSELFEIYVLDLEFAKRTYSLPIGSELRLSLEGNSIYLNILGRKYHVYRPGMSSGLANAMAESKPYHAYLKERQFDHYVIYDIFTIVVYYSNHSGI